MKYGSCRCYRREMGAKETRTWRPNATTCIPDRVGSNSFWPQVGRTTTPDHQNLASDSSHSQQSRSWHLYILWKKSGSLRGLRMVLEATQPRPFAAEVDHLRQTFFLQFQRLWSWHMSIGFRCRASLWWFRDSSCSRRPANAVSSWAYTELNRCELDRTPELKYLYGLFFKFWRF